MSSDELENQETTEESTPLKEAASVKDLEDEIEGLHARQTRIEEEINGIQDFIAQKQEGIKLKIS